MKILVLGGTSFLGRHFVEIALAEGHDLTLLNRGKTNPELFGSEVEKITADRDGDLSELDGGTWDAALDTSGYLPRVVAKSAEKLADRVDHYTFISSISVYADPFAEVDESSPVGTLEDESVEEITGETYGPLKALCEQSAQRAFDGRCLVLRPGLIVGPHDPTDRFTYWPTRIAAGGEVLAPGNPKAQVQVIDARDLAAWNLRLINEKTTGVFNATGPAEPLSMEETLNAINEALGGKSAFTWIPSEFLVAQQVGPWMEMTLWLGSDEAEMKADVSRAVAAGLTFRPIEEISKDTYEWASSRPTDYQWKAGLARDKEAAVLAAWSKDEGA